MQRTLLSILAATTCALAMSASQTASAADADLSCKLHYSLTGWSLIYKHSTGAGTIRCENGQTLRVHVAAKAIGLHSRQMADRRRQGRFHRRVHRLLPTFWDAMATRAEKQAS